MNLSLYTGGVKPYLEYGWVCAPNTAGQSITANTITTLTIDTEIADTGNFGSIASNQITLAAGTYYFEANTHHAVQTGNYAHSVLALYNVSDSAYVTRRGITHAGYSQSDSDILMRGQFTITASKVFDLRIFTYAGATIVNTGYTGVFTLATAGADQRTTIKLWKLA